MSEPSSSSWWHLSRSQRTGLVVCGVVIAGLLSVARWLQPDPSGLGTHQQLGLPPCTVHWYLHIRCPACGMTTSWAHFVRGEWTAAWKANAGGMLLALTGLLVLPWLWGSAARGRWMVVRPADWGVALYCVGILAVTLTHWLIRIAPDVWR